MKKYLLTWYGITDFRASLGFENSNGPVLAALLAEEFSDVIILGFSNKGKTNLDGIYGHSAFAKSLSDLKDTRNITPYQFVDIYANTQSAHDHFVAWLEERLHHDEINTSIHFHPVCLKHLNDTEGIYEAVTQALNNVSSEEGEKIATLYLSPGTPVMAFVWAFAALRYPNLKKRLIASSQADRPPETVVLPNEWLEWHGRQVKTGESGVTQFDVVFHLFGEQRMPSLLGVLNFPGKRHIFVNSKQFPAHVMKQFIGDAEYGEISVDPYDPENVRSTILGQTAKIPDNIRIGFNLTGGTKLMYAGALAACRKINATPFYFNSRSSKVIFLNDFTSIDTTLISSVETFIKLNGDKLFISKRGHWDEIPGVELPQRNKLTDTLWQYRSKISKVYKELCRYNDEFKPFDIHRGDICVKLFKDKKAIITLGSNHFEFEKWPDFARYVAGGWFEEYVYTKLRLLLDSGLIKDLRIGLEVSFKETSSANRSSGLGEQLSTLFGDTYQELDITFTDGKRLYVIECKAGYVTSEHIMKLQNIIRYFGGIEGRGVLVSCFPPSNAVVRKKIADSKNLQAISGDNIIKQIKSIIESGGNY